MKTKNKLKLLGLVAGISLGPLQATAQTVIWEENFDAYEAGELLEPQSDEWYGWGGDTGTLVSDDFSISGDNAMLSRRTPETWSDPLHDFDFTEGHYTLELSTYLETGSSGYFNILNSKDPLDWGFEIYLGECYFVPDGSGLYDGDIALDLIASFETLYDEWMHFKLDIDIDNDIFKLYLNEELIYDGSWVRSGTNATIGSLNFYSAESDNTALYVDDIKMSELISFDDVSISENASQTKLTLYQNNHNQLVIQSELEMREIEIYNLAGSVVKTVVVNNNQIQLSTDELDMGVYMIRVLTENGVETKKIVLK